MPTIIKRGVDPREDRFRLTCECGTVADFAQHEVQHDQRENDSWVTCPVCSRCVTTRSPLVRRVRGDGTTAGDWNDADRKR